MLKVDLYFEPSPNISVSLSLSTCLYKKRAKFRLVPAEKDGCIFVKGIDTIYEY